MATNKKDLVVQAQLKIQEGQQQQNQLALLLRRELPQQTSLQQKGKQIQQLRTNLQQQIEQENKDHSRQVELAKQQRITANNNVVKGLDFFRLFMLIVYK